MNGQAVHAGRGASRALSENESTFLGQTSRSGDEGGVAAGQGLGAVGKKLLGRGTEKAAELAQAAKDAEIVSAKGALGATTQAGNRLVEDLRRLREIGGVQLEVGRAGGARVKRMIYPAGFRWSVDMKPIVGTELCMHAHVGFLANGEIHIEYADGCVAEYKALQVVAIDPGHDGRVIGQEPAVLIEFDFEGDTIDRLGMPASHRHS